jgi:hypothetical protein
VGKRSNDDARVFIHQLVLCLAPGRVPAFTSDGLRQYFFALTAHFGHWHWPNSLRGWVVSGQRLYGQLVKQRGKKKADGKLFTIIRMKAGNLKNLVDHLCSLDLTGTVHTTIIERFNLTARHGIAPLPAAPGRRRAQSRRSRSICNGGGCTTISPGSTNATGARARFAAALPGVLPGDGCWSHRPSVVGG